MWMHRIKAFVLLCDFYIAYRVCCAIFTLYLGCVVRFLHCIYGVLCDYIVCYIAYMFIFFYYMLDYIVYLFMSMLLCIYIYVYIFMFICICLCLFFYIFDYIVYYIAYMMCCATSGGIMIFLNIYIFFFSVFWQPLLEPSGILILVAQ